jgi:hypothetical protein
MLWKYLQSSLECHPVLVLAFCHKSHGIPFLFGLTVPQQFIFFLAKLSNKSGEEKKLSMYNLWPRPSTLLVRSVTVAWVAVMSCVTHCQSFPKNTFMSWVYQAESHNLKILMVKLFFYFLFFYLMYCLKTILPMKRTMTSSIARCSAGL